MRTPFPWFGGKSRAAKLVWSYFGDPAMYVEPFFGSGGVLLNRPTPPKLEVINDKDHFVANFWRAVKYAPDEVAKYADWPVVEVELLARHAWLVYNSQDLFEKLVSDLEYYDAKIAGLWVWGQSAWFGSGFCSGKGPWKFVDGKLQRKPGPGLGVCSHKPHVSCRGMGIHRISQDAKSYIAELAERLKRVRVLCGDWKIVVSDGSLSSSKDVAVFLDPPYTKAVRTNGLYTVDDDVAAQVREWAIQHGEKYKVALCGLEHEHNMPDSWYVESLTPIVSYGTSNKNTINAYNRHLERIWFSPKCIPKTPLDAYIQN